MGIHNLMKFLRSKAPDSIRTITIGGLTGRTVACDASMFMYQFLIATQSWSFSGISELTDKDGNQTGHLIGLLNKTIFMMKNGLKPIWVFDGKPPQMKAGELEKRKKIKQEALKKCEEAKDAGNFEEAHKYNIRTTRVDKKMKEDAIKMLQLLGCPVVQSPGEAEAQCVELVKGGKAHAVATDDMDALTFGCKKMYKGFKGQKDPVTEIQLAPLLEQLNFTMEQFIDFCILCGCDYTGTIQNVGPVKAYKLISEVETIENVIKEVEKQNAQIDKSAKKKRRYNVPKEFLFKESRELFINPDVMKCEDVEVKFKKPQEEELLDFLVEQKGFNRERVEGQIKRIKTMKKKGFQKNLESFFGRPKIIKRAPLSNKKGSLNRGKMRFKKR